MAHKTCISAFFLILSIFYVHLWCVKVKIIHETVLRSRSGGRQSSFHSGRRKFHRFEMKSEVKRWILNIFYENLNMDNKHSLPATELYPRKSHFHKPSRLPTIHVLKLSVVTAALVSLEEHSTLRPNSVIKEEIFCCVKKKS